MMDDFLKLLKKKSDEQGGPKMNRHMEAKAAMAKELSDLLGSDLAEGVKGLKKVTVASDSEEGLEEGLEKAIEALDSEDGESMEDSESESEEMEGEEDMSEIEDEILKLEEQIKELIKQLKKKKK